MNVFVSYRRGPGASEAAGRLADRLVQRFGRDSVFIDVDAIRPGMDFVDAIDTAVGSCDVLVAVIDPAWAGDGGGRRRIDEPGDYVRLEIAAALRRKVKVIPVLVLRASMPRTDALPPDIAEIARRQALTLTHERFDRDVETLLDEIGPADTRRRRLSTGSTQSAWTTRPTRWAVGVVLGLVAAAAGFASLAYQRGMEGKDTLGWYPYHTDIYIVPLRVVALVSVGLLTIFLLATRRKR